VKLKHHPMPESSLVRGNTDGLQVHLYNMTKNIYDPSQRTCAFPEGSTHLQGLLCNDTYPHEACLHVQCSIALEIVCLRTAAFLCQLFTVVVCIALKDKSLTLFDLGCSVQDTSFNVCQNTNQSSDSFVSPASKDLTVQIQPRVGFGQPDFLSCGHRINSGLFGKRILRTELHTQQNVMH
jgi:hypothetical protein